MRASQSLGFGSIGKRRGLLLKLQFVEHGEDSCFGGCVLVESSALMIARVKLETKEPCLVVQTLGILFPDLHRVLIQMQKHIVSGIASVVH